MTEETKCCGACYYFEDEDVYGWGECLLSGYEKNCSNYCDSFKRKKED